MKALLNFGKNAGLSIAISAVIAFFWVIWCVAQVFHGLNRLTRVKR